MSDKKYFSRPAIEYLKDENLLEKDRKDAIFQDQDDNGRKINELFLEAKQKLKRIDEEEKTVELISGIHDAGMEHIKHAIIKRKIRKNTFSRWLGLLPISLIVLVTNNEVGIRVAAKEAENVKTIQLTDDGIDLAKYASAMTILGMLVALYVVFREEEKKEEYDKPSGLNTKDLLPNGSPLLNGLVKYVYGNFGKKNILVSDTLFYKFGYLWPGDANIDEVIATMKDYQILNSRVIDLESEMPAYDNGADFHGRVFSMCAIVIGSMSDKDILKLVNLLGKDKSVDEATAMLVKFIDSDVNLRGLIKSVLDGNVDTSLLGPIKHNMNKRHPFAKHR